jgi:cobaltochelatase CobN
VHLLATEPGTIADGSEAIDLAQTPGDIIVLASADTETALLAAAQARLPGAPSLRLAPVMRLGHNLSVDLYMEVVAKARLVVARLLGGEAYWPYGVERLAETCRARNIPLALLPGDDKPDRELARLSTLPAQACQRLWRYLAEGGPGNAENFLRYAASLISGPSPRPSPRKRGEGENADPLPACGEREGPIAKRWEGEGPFAEWAEPAPLLRAGYYWPEQALPSLADRVLPGAGAIREYGAGRRAGAGADGAQAEAAADLCPKPQGR